ncbi:MAG: DUF1285 domain-containing protein [Pseudomonadales bacterium]
MSADELFEKLLEELRGQRRPPVEQWHPEQSGRIDIRIDRQGQWFHEGDLIRRAGLVRVFASILRRDPDGYVLVTPAERLMIEVEDVPFLAVDCEVRHGASPTQTELLFTTNVSDLVLADSEHPVWLERGAQDLPYVRVRPGLDARITRSVYYRLLDQAVIKEGVAYLLSSGSEFPLGPVE